MTAEKNDLNTPKKEVRLNLNSKKMKKLINGFLVIIAVIFLTMSCKKEITNQTEDPKV